MSQGEVLYTIGHSDHELEAFVSLLRMHGVTAVADVRSQPYSRFLPQYNREVLKVSLREAGIGYVFLGEELGARRAERACYREGRARYELIAGLAAFGAGLERVREGMREHRVALMCAEKDPVTCHRMVLVCRRLRGEGFEIGHILEDGRLETNEEAEGRLIAAAGLAAEGLFQSREQIIEEAYDVQGERIAYVEREVADAEAEGVA